MSQPTWKGMLRTAKWLELNPQSHAYRAMNMLQAQGMKKHVLTRYTTGQSQPQGSLNIWMRQTLSFIPYSWTSVSHYNTVNMSTNSNPNSDRNFVVIVRSMLCEHWMLEIDASTTSKWFFSSLLPCKQCKIFSPFPHQSVTTEILSTILGKIFILVLFSVALREGAIFRLSSTWTWHVYTIVRDTQSSCGGPLTWKAQIHEGGHWVNFDRNLPSTCLSCSIILMPII